MTPFRRPIDDIVETLHGARRDGRGCSLLIGAGRSVSAGIPSAAGFVERIEQLYPDKYEAAARKTYPDCMAALDDAERRYLLSEYIDTANINWANICIALLMHEGYVDRLLTVNFDPLIVRACALLGDFPAVYDLAASQLFRPHLVPKKAVLHLHGQHTGFLVFNTDEEVRGQSERLGPVFLDAGRARPWIVAGYSGENDPVFEHLASVSRFDKSLYWVVRGDGQPPKHVTEQLLIEGKGAYYANADDADSFFITLTQKLGLFPPAFVTGPFTHLSDLIDTLAPYPLPITAGQTGDDQEDVTRTQRRWIEAAVDLFERGSPVSILPIKPADRLVVEAERRLMAGDYDGVVALRG